MNRRSFIASVLSFLGLAPLVKASTLFDISSIKVVPWGGDDDPPLLIHGHAYARVQRPGGKWVAVHHRPEGPVLAVVRNYCWTPGMEVIDMPADMPCQWPEDYPV